MVAATPELARYSFATAVIWAMLAACGPSSAGGPGLRTRVDVWTRAKGATGRSAY